MAKQNKERSYWPHMILGFLVIGITLGYWTVKSATSIPVQESNEYMMKYQQADMHINDILAEKARFDKAYKIQIDAQTVMHDVENSKAHKQQRVVLLHKGENRFVYFVTTKEGKSVEDANVSFLLTRPHTVNDDVTIENVPFRDSAYVVNDVNISKPGRYVLRLRAKIGDGAGYLEVPAYLKPE